MDNQFVNCPKCGIRNFADDPECGICGNVLVPQPSAPSVKQSQIVKPPITKKAKKPWDKTQVYLAVLVVICALAMVSLFYKRTPTPTSETAITQQASLEYSLVEISTNNQIKFVVEVRVNQKASDAQLRMLAEKVREEIDAASEIGTVFFLLPEMVSSNGAWAAVDFKPDMQVRIIGQSIADERKIAAGLSKITDYVGLWVDNGTPGDIIIRIRRDRQQRYVFEYLSSTDPKPDDDPSPLNRIEVDGRTVFKDIEHSNDYFVLEKNGDLTACDEHGFIATFKKLK